ncbi:Signal transduction histidine kinase [Acetitomaculum ruminis DSM 5522]|uniref:histidine kinase n=1 Tax=Acetitomaculum ruminis DSM 5522 TaxID=1120918 RepID=A0A1I0Y545_9FIRM|nr:HAMP domain-containing sensor histidine kinase [Acetitomaculum ruminis]SFB07558.1 Signal transduction histidine kinase [Acetitomaculum ruminis DSM 5522]
MNKFKKVRVAFVISQLLIILLVNIFVLKNQTDVKNRSYLVDVKRIVDCLNNGQSLEDINLDDYKYIINITPYIKGEHIKNEYTIEEINGVLYKFEYIRDENDKIILVMNLSLFVMLIFSLFILLYLEKKVIRPFSNITHLPGELAKGNLVIPILEEKSKFFGKFLWGMDMLRQKLEDDKKNELELLKDRKTLVLSLSHDIKTPLWAIDLYTKALMNNLYEDENKKRQALVGIEKNTLEIKKFVNEITNATKNDFLALKVNNGEVYLFDILLEIKNYYTAKAKLSYTSFTIDKVNNCLVYGDKDRIVEVMQNILENAIKYGDGKEIRISFDEEEDCQLITISNTGNTLKKEEMTNLFESFYRGSNSKKVSGSGLGLYICKELMHKMDGDIFAKSQSGIFKITLVLKKY